MAQLKPIRIGETFQRTYRFYNPVTPPTDPPTLDLASPINLTGLTVVFVLKNGSTINTYTTATGLTVTPLSGLVTIELEAPQTALLKRNQSENVSYMQFTDTTGNVYVRSRRKEKVLLKESV